MTLLVTGATGFVGRTLVEDAVSRRLPVRLAARAAVSIRGIKAVGVGDLSGDTDWQAAVEGCDQVVHLAALAHVVGKPDKSTDGLYRRINRDATLALARQAAEAGVRRFVFVSSVKVSGEGLARPYRETDPPAPTDAYGHSKWEAEQGLAEISSPSDMEVVVLRPPLVYGPGVKANFLRLMNAVEKGWPLPFGLLDNQRSLIFSRNLTDAILAGALKEGKVGGTYFVSDREVVSTRELVQRLARALDRPARLLPIPPGLMKTAASVLGRRQAAQKLLESLTVETSAVEEALEWRAPVPMDQGLDETGSWFRARGGENKT